MGDDTTETAPSSEKATKENKLMEYYKNFIESEDTQQIIKDRLDRAQKTDPTVTEIEVLAAFLGTQQAKDVLWNYYNQHEFGYDSSELSLEFRAKLQAYYQQIRKMTDPINQIRWSGDRETILREDKQRSSLHSETASQLVRDGVAPNLTIARVLTHFIAIADGMDQPDRDREERRRRALAA